MSVPVIERRMQQFDLSSIQDEVNAIREVREATDRRFVDLWFAPHTIEARAQSVEQLTNKN